MTPPVRPRNCALILLVSLISGAVLAAASRSRPDELARGRYLVENVAGCGDCHTPRDAKGALAEDRVLAGAPIGFAPLGPISQWATWAPPLAGLPSGFDQRQLASFLQTGVRPDGSQARAPMPQFRLNAQDARAVAAYVQSLRP